MDTKWGFGLSFAALDISGLDRMLAGTDAVPRRWGRTETHNADIDVIYVPDFTDRVHAGMDLLDVVAPGWAAAIDVGTLDLCDGAHCVLGQTWPHYRQLLELAVGADTPLPPLVDSDLVTPFTHMLEYASADQDARDDTDHMKFAGAIGCQLAQADFFIANMQAKRWVVEHEHLEAGGPVSLHAAKVMSDLSVLIVKQMYEQLTHTWMRELSAAHEAGRWDDSPVTVDLTAQAVAADALVRA